MKVKAWLTRDIYGCIELCIGEKPEDNGAGMWVNEWFEFLHIEKTDNPNNPKGPIEIELDLPVEELL